MINFEEDMIQKSRNLKKGRRLPKRWVYRLARHFDKGGFIPIFDNPADNYAIEAACAQYRLRATNKKIYNRKRGGGANL